MSKELGTVKLWGRNSTMPGIPDANIRCDVIAEKDALIIRARNDQLALSIPWQSIKSSYHQWEPAKDAVSQIMNLVMVLAPWLMEHFVGLKFYSAEHDMDMTLFLYTGNSLDGSGPEKEAVRIAKAIWTCRSDALAKYRNDSSIVYR